MAFSRRVPGRECTVLPLHLLYAKFCYMFDLFEYFMLLPETQTLQRGVLDREDAEFYLRAPIGKFSLNVLTFFLFFLDPGSWTDLPHMLYWCGCLTFLKIYDIILKKGFFIAAAISKKDNILFDKILA